MVILDAGPRIFAAFRHVKLEELSRVIQSAKPDVIAIDSPSAFAKSGRRQTERFVTSLGLSLHHTPEADAAPDVFPGPWIRAGLKVFDLAHRSGYPLFDGAEFKQRAFEVYPYASAVVLDGRMRPSDSTQVAWRRGVLQRAGIDTRELRDIALVNAALAALTGLHALGGRACWEGDPEEGLIVLPCRRADLLPNYRRVS